MADSRRNKCVFESFKIFFGGLLMIGRLPVKVFKSYLEYNFLSKKIGQMHNSPEEATVTQIPREINAAWTVNYRVFLL